jgi:predicted small integral membrane protein
MGNLHQGKSLDVVFPSVSVKYRTVVSPPVFETLQLATCSGKPKISIILSCERPTTHWE